MRDRARRHLGEEAAARRPAPDRPAPDALTLLRQAGNQATVRALARAPRTAARQEAVLIDGIGEIAIIDFTVKPPNAMSVTFESGPVDARLQQAHADGASIATVVLKLTGHTETLRDAVVSEFKLAPDHAGGPPRVTVEFTGEALEFK